MDNKQIRQRIYEYLMSTTLKDSSIIFSFQKPGYNNTQDIAGGQSQFYNLRYLLFLYIFVMQ